jgi:hypothetical protein
MRVRPISFDALVDELADRLAGTQPGGRLRVAIDGAPTAGPARLADAVVNQLRVRGRPAARIATDDFLRPASVRLESGRRNPDAFYAGWLDEPALRREVLGPAGPGGTGPGVLRGRGGPHRRPPAPGARAAALLRSTGWTRETRATSDAKTEMRSP